MIKQMLKRLSGNRNVKLVHVRKIRTGPLTGFVVLGEENLFGGAMECLPGLDPALQRTELAVMVLARIGHLEMLKEGLALQGPLGVF